MGVACEPEVFPKLDWINEAQVSETRGASVTICMFGSMLLIIIPAGIIWSFF